MKIRRQIFDIFQGQQANFVKNTRYGVFSKWKSCRKVFPLKIEGKIHTVPLALGFAKSFSTMWS